MPDQIDLRSEAALDAFIAGLDSPNHSPESRRSWCRLFLRDAAMGHLRLFTVPTISDESRRTIADDLYAFGITSPKIEADRTRPLDLGSSCHSQGACDDEWCGGHGKPKK